MNFRFLSNVFVFWFFFLFSYLLVQSYTGGDQEHYRKLYETFSKTLFSDILRIGLVHIGSAEPLTMLILWAGAKLHIDKDIYISFWNAILSLGLFILSRKHRMNLLFTFLLLTNFYVIVLMTGAERLKFAMIFLIYSFIYFNSRKLHYGFMLISPLAHFQSLIFISGYISHVFSNQILRFFFSLKIKKSALFFSVVVLIFLALFLVVFSDILLSKFDAYFSSSSISSLFNILLLSVLVLFIARNKFAFFLMLFVLAVFVLLFGGERVNMIAFFLSLFFLILEKRADHPLFLLLMVYFSVKSIPFVYNIMVHGNGFHG